MHIHYLDYAATAALLSGLPLDGSPPPWEIPTYHAGARHARTVYTSLFPRAECAAAEIDRALRGCRLLRITYTRAHARAQYQTLPR